jgi:hypothetical protein
VGITPDSENRAGDALFAAVCDEPNNRGSGRYALLMRAIVQREAAVPRSLSRLAALAVQRLRSDADFTSPPFSFAGFPFALDRSALIERSLLATALQITHER